MAHYPMSVFDEESGPLCEQHEAEIILTLAMAGLSLEQYRAWRRFAGGFDGRAN